MRAGTAALLGSLALASVAGGQATDSVALTVAMFRAAIVQGQLTAHGGAVPEVLCLARSTSSRGVGGNYSDPDSIVVARVRQQSPTARPVSECRIDPLDSAPHNTSLVIERATGRRGLVIWVGALERDSTGALTVPLGYYEHGLSAAGWSCAVRRTQDEWFVNACVMRWIS
jgi:hypothetical protein